MSVTSTLWLWKSTSCWLSVPSSRHPMAVSTNARKASSCAVEVQTGPRTRESGQPIEDEKQFAVEANGEPSVVEVPVLVGEIRDKTVGRSDC